MCDEDDVGFRGGAAETIVVVEFPRRYKEQILSSEPLWQSPERIRSAIAELKPFFEHPDFTVEQCEKCSPAFPGLLLYVTAVAKLLEHVSATRSTGAMNDSADDAKTAEDWLENKMKKNSNSVQEQGRNAENPLPADVAIKEILDAFAIAEARLGEAKLSAFQEYKALAKPPAVMARVRNALAVLVKAADLPGA